MDPLDFGDELIEEGDECPDLELTKSAKKNKKPPKPKPKRGPGRPKKQRQPTAPGAKGFDQPPPSPQFEEDPTPYTRDVRTEDLLNPPPPLEEDDEPPLAPEDEIADAIDYYEELWEQYPHLKLIPTLTHKDFTSESRMEDIEREIDRVERLGTKPFKDKMYSGFWTALVLAVTKLLSVSPLGDVLEPEPSPENPKPVKLSKELMKPEVEEQARPAIEEIFDMFPVLEYLGNLGDPRVQLAYTISSCVLSTYRANSERIAANASNVM